MRVLVLGATGHIGSAIADELIANDHEVVALARSDASVAKLANKSLCVIRGDLRAPDQWCGIVHEIDAVIHAAATFSEDMGEVDRHLVGALIAHAKSADTKIRFIYTGGCWLYGKTGDRVANEASSFNPLPAFKWMIENSREVSAVPCFDTMIIHPAMTYDREGGAISRWLKSASEIGTLEVWGSLETRWPVVHREDLAHAYRLVLESGEAGQSYCASAQAGVRVGDMASAINRRFNLKTCPQVLTIEQVITTHGKDALGPTLDQQMSGKKIIENLGWKPKYPDILSEIG